MIFDLKNPARSKQSDVDSKKVEQSSRKLDSSFRQVKFIILLLFLDVMIELSLVVVILMCQSCKRDSSIRI